MKKYGLAVLMILPVIIIMATGCKNKTQKNIEVTNDTARFYPVNEYIVSQVNHVDSTAQFIYKITVTNGVKDSVVLTKQQFNQLAQAFLEYNISDKSIHNYYKESTFMDDATHSYTINYTCANTSLPLQTVDVLLNVESSEVKRIFLNKTKNKEDGNIVEKDGWKSDESFFINRATQKNGSTSTEQITVVWHTEP